MLEYWYTFQKHYQYYNWYLENLHTRHAKEDQKHSKERLSNMFLKINLLHVRKQSYVA